MITSLAYLVKGLQKSSPRYQVELLKSYQAKDWKSIIKYPAYYDLCNETVHTELWRSNMSSLVLIGWNNNQDEHIYSNYGVIHTIVLEGYIQDKKSLTLLCPYEYHYTKPHDHAVFKSRNRSASLHLFQTSYLY